MNRQLVQDKLMRFRLNGGWQDEYAFVHDARFEPVLAAVLIPIVVGSKGPTILLTQRTEHLEKHAGQISFPGGKVADSDVDREDTALRETYEEVGLRLDRSIVLGSLPEYDIRTGFRVTPIVGWIDGPVSFQIDVREVASTIQVPLEFVLNLDNYQLDCKDDGGNPRYFYRLPYLGHNIWGATAGMLRIFATAVSDQR
ncbi:MAG: CoA pyrophosphatase [Betaproteobacteria bacterium]